MYYYFYSLSGTALKLNGVFYGLIDKNSVKCVNLNGDSTFVELCPTEKNSLGASFILSNNFLTSPPNNIAVTDLKGGYLIHLKENNIGFDFNIIAQEKFGDCAVSVFNEGGLKLSLESNQGFLADNFDFTSNAVTVSKENVNGYPLVFVHFADKNVLCVYSLNGSPKRVFLKEIESFSVKDGFSFTERLFDIAKHVITVNATFDGKVFKETNKNISCSKNFVKEDLCEKIIPYAFLEELKAGGNVDFYLSDNIKKFADKLKSYLGDYIGIMPPPTFRDINEIGLVYSKTQNYYYVDYVTVSLINGKIDNVKRSAT